MDLNALLIAAWIHASLLACDSSSSTFCNDAYSCEFNRNITDTDVSNCNGYFSCAFSELISISTKFSCDGSYSCYGLQSIDLYNQTSQQIPNLYCNGLYSCANISKIMTITNMMNTKIFCNGELSCYNTTIIISNLTLNYNIFENGQIFCNGDRSCANSSIWLQYGTVADVSGYLGAQNATFYASPGANIQFSGISSGQNVSIVCIDPKNNNHHESANLVSVYCNPNACIDLQTQNSAFCFIGVFLLSISDGYSWPSTGNVTITPAWPQLYLNVSNAATVVENSFHLCQIPNNMTSIIYTNATGNLINYRRDDLQNWNWITNYIHGSGSITINTGKNNSYSINCENYKQCTDNTLESKHFVDQNVHDIQVPVCCTAGKSCINSPNITTTLVSGDTNDFNVSVRCDGFSSCEYSKFMIVSMTGRDYAQFYSSGKSATKNSIIDGSLVSRSNIFCTGYESCALNTTIQYVTNIFCTGTNSCTRYCLNESGPSLMQNIHDSIYLYGASDMCEHDIGVIGNESEYQLTKIENVGGNVFCAFACTFVSFFNIGGNVQIFTYPNLQTAFYDPETLTDCIIDTVGYNVYLASLGIDHVQVYNINNSVFITSPHDWDSFSISSFILRNITNVCI